MSSPVEAFEKKLGVSLPSGIRGLLERASGRRGMLLGMPFSEVEQLELVSITSPLSVVPIVALSDLSYSGPFYSKGRPVFIAAFDFTSGTIMPLTSDFESFARKPGAFDIDEVDVSELDQCSSGLCSPFVLDLNSKNWTAEDALLKPWWFVRGAIEEGDSEFFERVLRSFSTGGIGGAAKNHFKKCGDFFRWNNWYLLASQFQATGDRQTGLALLENCRALQTCICDGFESAGYDTSDITPVQKTLKLQADLASSQLDRVMLQRMLDEAQSWDESEDDEE